MKNTGRKPKRDDWFKIICKSLKDNTIELSGVPLPGFPEKEIQINTTGQAGKKTLREAYLFYNDCLNVFKDSLNFQKEEKYLIDFGVGWGRVLRFFMYDFKPENLYGIDINEDLLKICKSTFAWGNFIKSNAFPPLAIPDESVDYIVGYSVFSHLSEAACLRWIEEFSRILCPGGILALTTRGRWFLDYCESLRNITVNGYSKALSELFTDFEEAKNKYDHGEFLHSNIEGVSGGGPLNSGFYGESFISEKYAKREYSKYFSEFRYNFVPERMTHPIMYFKK